LLSAYISNLGITGISVLMTLLIGADLFVEMPLENLSGYFSGHLY
jgi:hypothetical protein